MMGRQTQFHATLLQAFILLLLIVSIMPMALVNLSIISPLLEAVCIFYWSLYRPRLIPYWFVLIVGFCWDALYGLSMGVTALGCVGLRFLASFYQEQLSTHIFSYFWRSAALSLGIYALYKWLVLSVLMDEILPKHVALLQWAMTVALYPLFHGFFNMICVYIPEKRDHA